MSFFVVLASVVQKVDNANHWAEMYLVDNTMIIWFAGLDIKKILRLLFGDQLEKYSRQFVTVNDPAHSLAGSVTLILIV